MHSKRPTQLNLEGLSEDIKHSLEQLRQALEMMHPLLLNYYVSKESQGNDNRYTQFSKAFFVAINALLKIDNEKEMSNAQLESFINKLVKEDEEAKDLDDLCNDIALIRNTLLKLKDQYNSAKGETKTRLKNVIDGWGEYINGATEIEKEMKERDEKLQKDFQAPLDRLVTAEAEIESKCHQLAVNDSDSAEIMPLKHKMEAYRKTFKEALDELKQLESSVPASLLRFKEKLKEAIAKWNVRVVQLEIMFLVARVNLLYFFQTKEAAQGNFLTFNIPPEWIDSAEEDVITMVSIISGKEKKENEQKESAPEKIQFLDNSKESIHYASLALFCIHSFGIVYDAYNEKTHMAGKPVDIKRITKCYQVIEALGKQWNLTIEDQIVSHITVKLFSIAMALAERPHAPDDIAWKLRYDSARKIIRELVSYKKPVIPSTEEEIWMVFFIEYAKHLVSYDEDVASITAKNYLKGRDEPLIQRENNTLKAIFSHYKKLLTPKGIAFVAEKDPLGKFLCIPQTLILHGFDLIDKFDLIPDAKNQFEQFCELSNFILSMMQQQEINVLYFTPAEMKKMMDVLVKLATNCVSKQRGEALAKFFQEGGFELNAVLNQMNKLKREIPLAEEAKSAVVAAAPLPSPVKKATKKKRVAKELSVMPEEEEKALTEPFMPKIEHEAKLALSALCTNMADVISDSIPYVKQRREFLLACTPEARQIGVLGEEAKQNEKEVQVSDIKEKHLEAGNLFQVALKGKIPPNARKLYLEVIADYERLGMTEDATETKLEYAGYLIIEATLLTRQVKLSRGYWVLDADTLKNKEAIKTNLQEADRILESIKPAPEIKEVRKELVKKHAKVHKGYQAWIKKMIDISQEEKRRLIAAKIARGDKPVLHKKKPSWHAIYRDKLYGMLNEMKTLGGAYKSHREVQALPTLRIPAALIHSAAPVCAAGSGLSLRDKLAAKTRAGRR